MKVIRILLIVTGFIFLAVSTCLAAVFFQEDFETAASDWACVNNQSVPTTNWDEGYTACGIDATFGAEWKIGAGRNGGNAIYAWKSSAVPNGYWSESQRWLTGSDVKTEIYHRWYMKVPTAANFNKTTSSGGGMKFWRYILRENGYSTPPEIYFNVRSSTKLADGDLVMISTLTGQFRHLINFSDINDNAWHCHELRLKANTNGNSDGIIQYWFDGVLTASFTGVDFADGTAIPNMAFHRLEIGIGNASDEAWDQTAWSAVGFDDYVVSTTYVGPASQFPSLTGVTGIGIKLQ